MGILLVLFILFLHILSFALPIIIIVLVIKEIKKVAKEGYEPPPTFTHENYENYLYKPIQLPKQLDFYNSPISNLISFIMYGIFGIAWIYTVVTGFKNGGMDGLWITVIGSFTFGLVFFMGGLLFSEELSMVKKRNTIIISKLVDIMTISSCPSTI